MREEDAIRELFLDAVLADVDLSAWGERLDLLLVGSHLGYAIAGCSAVVVSFVGVRDLQIAWNHDPAVLDSVHGGLRWNLHQVEAKRVAHGRKRWTITGFLVSPSLVVEFDRVEATPVDLAMVHQRFPRAGGLDGDGFLRPGLLEALAGRFERRGT